MTSEDIKNRKWTESEIRSLERIAAKQAASDDSEINYDGIPPLTDEQLAQWSACEKSGPKSPSASDAIPPFSNG